MLAAYAAAKEADGRNGGPARLIPVTNPIERANAEIKRRTNVVGVLPDPAEVFGDALADRLERLVAGAVEGGMDADACRLEVASHEVV